MNAHAWQIFAESIDSAEITYGLRAEFVQTIAPERLHLRGGIPQTGIAPLGHSQIYRGDRADEHPFSPSAELEDLPTGVLVFSDDLVDEARKALLRQSESSESDDEWAARLGAELGSFRD